MATGANLWPTADAFRPGLWESDQAHLKEFKDKPRTTAKEKNDWKLFMLDELEPHITLDQLHSIENPCLIVCGDHDLISIQHTVLIYQNIKHANLWVVPNSGHATLVEHADLFNKIADDFFSREFKDHS